MPATVPFTAYFKAITDRGPVMNTPVVRSGSRWSHLRNSAKLSKEIYDALIAATPDGFGNTITLANPGSSQYYSSGPRQNIADAMAWRPQIGNNPDLFIIEGFYNLVNGVQSQQPVSNTQLIHCNQSVTGLLGEQKHATTGGVASSTVLAEVAALKTYLELFAGTVTDASGASPWLFRLLYKGIIWGDRGHTFPV